MTNLPLNAFRAVFVQIFYYAVMLLLKVQQHSFSGQVYIIRMYTRSYNHNDDQSIQGLNTHVLRSFKSFQPNTTTSDFDSNQSNVPRHTYGITHVFQKYAYNWVLVIGIYRYGYGNPAFEKVPHITTKEL